MMIVVLVGPTANLIEIQVPSNFEYLVRLVVLSYQGNCYKYSED